MIRKILWGLILYFASFSISQAQHVEVSAYTLAGTNNQLPFWLWTNQLGRFDASNQFSQNFETYADHNWNKNDWNFTGAARINAALGENSKVFITELFTDINWKFLQVQAGAFAEAKRYNGLSASNGNLAVSRNARPHPKVRMGFNRFVQLFPGLSVKGFWEEGLLNDDRYVKDTHLHRKSLYLRTGKTENLQITAGLEHFVMWGGTHPKYGKLQGFEEYFNYVTGSAGGSDALMTDQLNVLGNQYGTYQLELKKSWKTHSLCFYLSHPFEDKSGLEWTNFFDNLYGLYFTFSEEKKLIQSVVLEYYHTKHQSGDHHLDQGRPIGQQGRGRDNYFNHGVYSSGATYHQMSMASPLFTPIRSVDGQSRGFSNTRFTGFHLGARGYLVNDLQWKLYSTFTKNLGVFVNNQGTTSFSPAKNQMAGLFQLNWQLNQVPLNVGLTLSTDHGELFEQNASKTNWGTMLSATWTLSE